LCFALGGRTIVDAEAAYQAAEPKDDAQFVPVFAHSPEHIGGYPPDDAIRVAKTLLPDILYYDPNRPASYPDNGRFLTDDVMDHFVNVISNGKVTRDNVGKHTDLIAEFPYVGPPHKVRSGDLVAA
jgi:hypothetical protein